MPHRTQNYQSIAIDQTLADPQMVPTGWWKVTLSKYIWSSRVSSWLFHCETFPPFISTGNVRYISQCHPSVNNHAYALFVHKDKSCNSRKPHWKWEESGMRQSSNDIFRFKKTPHFLYLKFPSTLAPETLSIAYWHQQEVRFILWTNWFI